MPRLIGTLPQAIGPERTPASPTEAQFDAGRLTLLLRGQVLAQRRRDRRAPPVAVLRVARPVLHVQGNACLGRDGWRCVDIASQALLRAEPQLLTVVAELRNRRVMDDRAANRVYARPSLRKPVQPQRVLCAAEHPYPGRLRPLVGLKLSGNGLGDEDLSG